MKRLRKMLDRVEPLFIKGGRLENFHAIYEMVDTLLYSPPDVTRSSPHIRDAIDLKRVMIIVVFAATPCALVGMWNTGFQANTAMLKEYLAREWPLIQQHTIDFPQIEQTLEHRLADLAQRRGKKLVAERADGDGEGRTH